MDFDRISLIMLPGNPPPNFPYKEMYNKAYEFYKNTWQRIFNRPHRPPLYDAYGFFRQNYIFQLSEGDKIIAQTLGTHLNLEHSVTTDLAFFEKFKGKANEFLKLNNVRSILSLEYSAVTEKYSPRNAENINFYDIILLLSMRMAKALDVDAIIGHPRRLTKTNSRVYAIGYTCIESQKTKYNVSVDIVVGLMKNLIEPVSAEIKSALEKLWENRIDTIGISRNDASLYFSYFQKAKKPEFANVTHLPKEIEMTASFKDIVSAYEDVMSEAKKILYDFPWEDKGAYARWLAHSFYFVSHSTKLLNLAGEKARADETNLKGRMISHEKEEQGHEFLALQDLRKLGYQVQEFPELSTTSAFYSKQYDEITNTSSTSFMGWILFLEGIASKFGPKILERASIHHPATNFLRVHAEEDQEHIQSAFSLMETLPEKYYAAAIKNMRVSCRLYLETLLEIARSTKSTKAPLSA